MSKKLIYLVSFVLLVSLVGDVQAAEIHWTDAGPDHLWSTAANWDSLTVPTFDDQAAIGWLPDTFIAYEGPTIANEGAVAEKVWVGAALNQTGVLTVDGGTVEITAYPVVGRRKDSNGTLNMISGTINSGSFRFGYQGSGTLNMTGGTITINDDFRIADQPTAIGHANLDGGTITIGNLQMRREAGAVGTMDVGGGTLIINGDKLSRVQGYIDNGWITAYDGNGTLQLDYDVTNEGKTTLKATPFLNPNPTDGGLVSPGEVELSWTLPDPCMPGQPVSVDVYFTDDLELLKYFTDPAAIQVVSKQDVTSVVVQTQLKTRYYWAVDTYIGDPNDPIFGSIFSFLADNIPPEVDAGKDVLTWLVDGVRTKNLDGTVTDDGLVSPYTVQWTMVTEPYDPNDPNSPDAAVIADPTAEDTSITMTGLGEYVLQLEAFDGEYTSSDTVTINVYNDSCEAVQSLPDYQPLIGDLNGDCKVDDVDLALLQENWLKDNSLTEEYEE